MTSLYLIRNEASNWGNCMGGNIFVQCAYTNCMDITMAWKTSWKDVATCVGSFALHIIF